MVENNIDLDAKELLTLVHNALSKTFFQVPRTQAKQLFQSIIGGEKIPLMTLGLRSDDEFKCELALDSSEFIGNLNFRFFRDALASHLHRIAFILKNDEKINIFTNTHNNDVIFHHPGVIDTDGRVNILVSGIEQRQADTISVKLLFLDPAKLEEAAASSSSVSQLDM